MSGGFVAGHSAVADLVLTPEVCVVGSGAGGAVTAFHLQSAGHDVLVVEEGGHYTRADFRMQESDAYPQLYQEGGQRVTEDLGVLVLQGRAVGGTTVVNWTTSFRTPQHTLEHWRKHHAIHDVTEAALNPHWDAVEERLGVHKVAEADMNRNNRLLFDGCKALGWQVETTRRNVRGCRQTGYCGMGCPVDAKQSMLVTYLPDAVAAGATVLSRCRIDNLETDGRTVVRARGTLLDAEGLKPTGRKVEIRARRFILSAGAIGTPAILLRSGMADGVVGTRTFLHPVVVSTGVYDQPVLACYGAPQSAASHQFVQRGDDVGFFMEVAPLHPVLMATAMPGLARDHADNMKLFPNVAPHIALCVDGFHPDVPGGTVRLRDSGRPLLDYPVVPRIREAMRTAQMKLAEAQLASGARYVVTSHEPPLTLRSTTDIHALAYASFDPGRVFMVSAHVMGGARMGDDPKDAFVRSSDLRAHRFDNLHVVDGSAFPTSLGVNPQLSIYGLARLATQRMLESWPSAT